MSEHQEQCALFEWAALKSRQIPELSYLFAVPNGGFRHKATAAKLKREGLKRGVPDTCLPIGRHGFLGWWGEMKYGKNRPTKDQARWMSYLKKQGHFVGLFYNWREAAESLVWYLTEGIADA